MKRKRWEESGVGRDSERRGGREGGREVEENESDQISNGHMGVRFCAFRGTDVPLHEPKMPFRKNKSQ